MCNLGILIVWLRPFEVVSGWVLLIPSMNGTGDFIALPDIYGTAPIYIILAVIHRLELPYPTNSLKAGDVAASVNCVMLQGDSAGQEWKLQLPI